MICSSGNWLATIFEGTRGVQLFISKTGTAKGLFASLWLNPFSGSEETSAGRAGRGGVSKAQRDEFPQLPVSKDLMTKKIRLCADTE
jgi:hypothetical protein